MGAGRAKASSNDTDGGTVWFRAARISTSRPRPILSSRSVCGRVTSLSPQQMANFLLEKILAEQIGSTDRCARRKAHRQTGRRSSQDRSAKRIGNMWLLRWKDKTGGAFLRASAELTYRSTVMPARRSPGHLAAFNVLREVHGSQGRLGSHAQLRRAWWLLPMSDAERASLMLQTGRMTWRDMGDAATARTSLLKCCACSPENEELQSLYRRFGVPSADA